MAQGFYWTANSPYLQSIWVRVRRTPRAAALGDDGTIMTGPYRNANPAYIIYECLTNTDWGMGGPTSDIEVPSFQYAAQVFKNENLGLFLLWDKQSTIEDFVGDVLDHVQAYLFLNPATGLLTLKPLRNDYDINTLPVFDPDNCNVADFDRKVWGETINEIVVTWTNPITEKPETITVQDLANIVQQGGQIVSQSRDYVGIRSADVALAAATRDLRTACSPLATFRLVADRRAWSLKPGDCFVLNWPEENAIGLVGRVQQVDYGDSNDGPVNATVIEDVFALDSDVYIGAQPPQWEDTARVPNPPANVKLTTAPAFVIANAALDDIPVEPEVNTLMLVADPNPDFLRYEPYTATTLSNGTVVQASTGTQNPVPYTTLSAAMVAEASTVVANLGAQLADLVFVDDEIMLVQAIDGSGNYTLYRGVLDTVPVAHAAGAPMWFLSAGLNVVDDTPRAPGEQVTYRLLMQTSIDLLAFSEGVDQTVLLDWRPYRPLRPANVQVNGIGFGSAGLGGQDAQVTWGNRNRLLETSQVLGWQASTVAPENAQSTQIEVLASSGDVLKTYVVPGSATAYTVPAADLTGGSRIRVWALRDGLLSYQAHVIAYT